MKEKEEIKKNVLAQDEKAYEVIEAASKATHSFDNEDFNLFVREMASTSKKIILRIPKSLKRSLTKEAKLEGVSLENYILYILSRR